MAKLKIIRVTTIPLALNLLLRGQLRFLNAYFDIVALSSPGKDLDQVRERENVRTIALSMKREISPFHDIVSFVKLFRLLRLERPDILHANTPKASLLSMIAGALAGVPVRIYTVTGLRFETETGLKRKILVSMERLTCYFATHIVGESRGVKRMITEERLTKKNIVIIGNGNINGIDHIYWDSNLVTVGERELLKAELNITVGDFIFLFVGRLVKSKGINELVHVFKKVQVVIKNVRLVLVGPLEQDLDPLSQDVLDEITGNRGIIAVGFQEDIRQYMAISNVLILPSYREGFPNVILQAGAMGLPSIVTNVNGTEESMDEKNSIIISKKNEQELYDAMIKMYYQYNEIDKAYCRKSIISKFSQDYYYPLLLAFYNNLSKVEAQEI